MMTAVRFSQLVAWGRTVHLVGFPEDVAACQYMLGTIQSASNAAHVTPVSDVFVGMNRAVLQFDYLGFRYELEGDYKESQVHVDSLEKIARVEEGCDFSETYGDHMAIIVEDYRMQRQPPEWGTW